jgi:hypothetical protein
MHGPAFHLHASWAGVRDPINVLCRWFVDTPEQIARWREALHLWNATHNLPATCLAQHPSQAWRCFFPRYAAASLNQDTRINGAKFFALQPARDGLVPCLLSGVNQLQGLSARFHPPQMDVWALLARWGALCVLCPPCRPSSTPYE